MSADGTVKPHRHSPDVIRGDVDLYDAINRHLEHVMTISHLGTCIPDLDADRTLFGDTAQLAMFMIMDEVADAKRALDQWCGLNRRSPMATRPRRHGHEPQLQQVPGTVADPAARGCYDDGVNRRAINEDVGISLGITHNRVAFSRYINQWLSLII